MSLMFEILMLACSIIIISQLATIIHLLKSSNSVRFDYKVGPVKSK